MMVLMGDVGLLDIQGIALEDLLETGDLEEFAGALALERTENRVTLECLETQDQLVYLDLKDLPDLLDSVRQLNVVLFLLCKALKV